MQLKICVQYYAFTLVILNGQPITDYILGITVTSNLLITPLEEFTYNKIQQT